MVNVVLDKYTWTDRIYKSFQIVLVSLLFSLSRFTVLIYSIYSVVPLIVSEKNWRNFHSTCRVSKFVECPFKGNCWTWNKLQLGWILFRHFFQRRHVQFLQSHTLCYNSIVLISWRLPIDRLTAVLLLSFSAADRKSKGSSKSGEGATLSVSRNICSMFFIESSALN